MPLTFSDVRTVAGAVATGVVRSAYWLFSKVREVSDRTSFLRQRFPNLPLASLRAVYNRLEAAYQQGAEATQTDQLPSLGQMPSDPTHQSQGRIAYNVEITIRGWEGTPGRGRPPNLQTLYSTFHSDQVLSADELRQRMDEFVRESADEGRYRGDAGLPWTVTSYSYQIITVTRSY